jgi:hypothetical protein
MAPQMPLNQQSLNKSRASIRTRQDRRDRLGLLCNFLASVAGAAAGVVLVSRLIRNEPVRSPARLLRIIDPSTFVLLFFGPEIRL